MKKIFRALRLALVLALVLALLRRSTLSPSSLWEIFMGAPGAPPCVPSAAHAGERDK